MNIKLKKHIRNLLINLGLLNFYNRMKKEYFAFTDKYYNKSPILIANFFQDTIKDKIVCDLGCRKGHLMTQFLKYTKNVTGIEMDDSFYKICKNKGLDVIRGDYFSMILPKADIYYIWAVNEVRQKMLDKLKEQGLSGTIIMRLEPKQDVVFKEPVITIFCSRIEKIKIQVIKF